MAQSGDSLQTIQKDSAERSIRKATLLSAVLPGAGQVYNRKIWKVPIIYGLIGGLGYLAYQNQQDFKEYQNALIARLDDDPQTIDEEYDGIYSDDNLQTLTDFHRRNRDLCYIGMGLVYILNIIDAHVDAHLAGFRVDDDLSLNVFASPPLYGISNHSGGAIGLKLTF